MERPLVTAVTHSTDEARITLLGVPDQPGAAAAIFGALAEAGCVVDTIIQNEPLGDGRRAEVSFTIPQEDLPDALPALDAVARSSGSRRWTPIGRSARFDRGCRHALPSRRRREGVPDAGGKEINIEMIRPRRSRSRASFPPSRSQAVRSLHGAFELGAAGVEPEQGPR